MKKKIISSWGIEREREKSIYVEDAGSMYMHVILLHTCSIHLSKFMLTALNDCYHYCYCYYYCYWFISLLFKVSKMNLPVPLIPDGRIRASYFPAPRIWSRIFFSFSRKFTRGLLALNSDDISLLAGYEKDIMEVVILVIASTLFVIWKLHHVPSVLQPLAVCIIMLVLGRWWILFNSLLQACAILCLNEFRVTG